MFPSKRKVIAQYLDSAEKMGLLPADVANAKEMIVVGEFGFAFEIINEQLYEYDIPITAEFHSLAKLICDKLKMTEDSYSFLARLVE